MTEEYDFMNVLRLDGCFRFLTLGDRIHLHQSNISESYYRSLPSGKRDQLAKMSKALDYMQWEVPAFHTYREDANAQKYYVHVARAGEISETQYAELYKEEFEHFKNII